MEKENSSSPMITGTKVNSIKIICRERAEKSGPMEKIMKVIGK
jgi:hypothetical protein